MSHDDQTTPLGRARIFLCAVALDDPDVLLTRVGQIKLVAERFGPYSDEHSAFIREVTMPKQIRFDDGPNGPSEYYDRLDRRGGNTGD